MLDPNFAPIRFVYCLMVEGSWVMPLGFTSGVGAWVRARQFQNFSDAKKAVLNAEWHNDPTTVCRAKVVRLIVSVEPKFMEVDQNDF